MFHARRFATPAVLLAFGLVCAGSGCGAVNPALIPPGQLPDHVKVLRMQLPSFDEGLEGIWLWRRSEVSGEFEPISEIRLGRCLMDNGNEFLEYELLDPTGIPIGVTLSAAVDRSGPAPEFALWFVRFTQAGEWKATTYNAAGESPLSLQSIPL